MGDASPCAKVLALEDVPRGESVPQVRAVELVGGLGEARVVMAHERDMPGVTIIVDGEGLICRPGRPLLNELLNGGKLVRTACGGKGSCHLCRVIIENRERLMPPTALEKRALGNVLIAQGMRLSCQVQPVEGLRVRLPRVESPEERKKRIDEARRRREAEKGQP